ncbi:MAG: guanylate kinase [Nitrospiraceae bacterium]|nr:guanylate kinase [Nitrospiraceae bacterium]
MKRKNRGSLFIVSAPSGAGKTTLCNEISAILPNIQHSVSYTTRQKRKTEVNNRDYTFIKEDAFLKMAKKGGFLEWARVHGNLYGTSKKRLESMLNSGINVVLDIDTQGAKQMKKKYSEGIYIFILPPSMKILKERLKKRMANSDEEIKKRLRRAVGEIKDYKMYDYVIINDIFESALDKLIGIILIEGLRTKNINQEWIKKHFLK